MENLLNNGLTELEQVNLSISLRDDDTGLETHSKLHIYSADREQVLKCIVKDIVSMSKVIGVVDGKE